MAENRALGALFARLLSRVRPRMPRIERKQVGSFAVRRDEDGIEYISPTPNGAVPMNARRARH